MAAERLQFWKINCPVGWIDMQCSSRQGRVGQEIKLFVV